MDKYIICDTATSDYGKTQTLLKVIDKLKQLVKPTIERSIGLGDKFAVFNLNKKTIVVDTLGDPGTTFIEALMNAVNANANMIVCASRTAGNTMEFVNGLENEGYEIIRFSNFFAKTNKTSYEPCLHDISAAAIVKLIQKLIQ